MLTRIAVSKNLYLRSQAMETLSLLTDQNDNIDWLNTKNIDSEIHKRLFQMNKGEMIPNLLANMRNSYPGGSYTALRILAFFLSWVRGERLSATHLSSFSVFNSFIHKGQSPARVQEGS